MEFGLSQEHITKIRGVFNNYPEVEKVIIYGSRAMGNYKPYSDIDLTIESTSTDLALQFRIETELDDLMLAYKIDLSLFKTISNPDLVEHIERVGKVFFDKKSGFQHSPKMF